jgi:hypothetical protein
MLPFFFLSSSNWLSDGLGGKGDFCLHGASRGGMICMTEKWDRMKVTHDGGQRKETNEETHLSIYIMNKGLLIFY